MKMLPGIKPLPRPDYLERPLTASGRIACNGLHSAIVNGEALIVRHGGKHGERQIIPKAIFVSRDGNLLVDAWQLTGTREGQRR